MNPFLRKLTELDGGSGREQSVRLELEKYLKNNYEHTTDRIGNLYAHSKSYHPNDIKLMITAHMDEVGFIITEITDKGFLRFQLVGGIDERILPGKAVRVGKSRISGVIGSLAIHLQDKAAREKITPLEELYIDIGAVNQKQAEEYVKVGDYAYFDAASGDIGNLICAKALDDRVGCEVLLHVLQEVPEGNFTAVFTTREEVGCFGAKAAASAVKPKYAIVLEGTTASDIGETASEDAVCKVGNGPVLSFMDNATIYDKNFLKKVEEIADRKGIPYQLKEAVAGGNEAGAVQRSHVGCHVLAVSLPCRYIHGPVSVASEADIEAMKRLAVAIVTELK